MHTVLLEEDGQTKEYQVSGEKSLYVELEAQGVKLPHGCLAGACGACRIEVLEGSENLSTPSVIEQDTIDAISNDNGYNSTTTRLSCRASASGNVKFRPLK